MITPITDTSILTHAIRTLPLGRSHIQSQLMTLLSSDAQFKRELGIINPELNLFEYTFTHLFSFLHHLPILISFFLGSRELTKELIDFIMENMVEFAITTMDPDVHKGRKDRELARVEAAYDGGKVKPQKIYCVEQSDT